MTKNDKDRESLTTGGGLIRPDAVLGLCGAGGVLWSIHAILLAARPEGCVGAACGISPHRPSEDVAWVLLLAVVLLAAGAAMFTTRAAMRGRGLLRSGTGLVATGGVLLAVGIAVNATVDSSPLWWLHDSDALGRLLPVLGGLLIGLGVLRGRILPRWIGVALLVGAGSSVFVNVQDARVLLALPMAIAWVMFGVAVWRTGRTSGPSGQEGLKLASRR